MGLKIMCQEKGCSGELDLNNPVSLPVGCGMVGSSILTYPCDICGCLYIKKDTPAVDGAGNKAFLRGGNIVEEPAR